MRKIVHASAASLLGIIGAEDAFVRLCHDQCTGTHGTGFQRNYQFAAMQAARTQHLRCALHRQHFGMGKWAAAVLALVMRASATS